jgi:hypothetical protein
MGTTPLTFRGSWKTDALHCGAARNRVAWGRVPDRDGRAVHNGIAAGVIAPEEPGSTSASLAWRQARRNS